jgi:acetyltransferase-like isoleucine patch superfamily enzyme
MSNDKANRDFLGEFFWHAFYFRLRIYGLFNNLIRLICFIRGVKVGGKVNFVGLPRIRRYPYSSISIGNNCTFNSSKHSDFFGLVKPCTFVTLNRNAKIIIGDKVGATGVVIGSASRVQIGNNVLIGACSAIFDTDFHNPDPNIRLQHDVMPSRPVIIEDNVYMGFNCLILKGVTIGENSVIGANSVVINSIPRNSIAVGNPCKVIIRKNWEEKLPID